MEVESTAFNLDDALESAYTQMNDSGGGDSEITEAPVAEVEEKPVQSGEEVEVEAEKPIDPPVSWTAEAKERFLALPPELQEYVAKRESERESLLGQKSTEFSEQQRKYQALEQTIAPRREALIREYGGEAQALNQLFQLSDYAQQSPVEFIQWFAQQRGIDLQQLTPGNVDYEVDPITKQLTQRLASIEDKLTTSERNQQAQQQEQLRNEIEAIKQEKDDKGNLLRPHFDEVKQQMASLIQGGAAKTLQHAYDMAVWAHPEIRKKLQEEQEKTRLEAAKAAASKAEKAKGVTVKSKHSGETSSAKKGNWEDTLSELAGDLYGVA